MTVLPYTVMRQPGSCGAAFQNDNRHRGKTAAFSFHAGQSIVWIRNPGTALRGSLRFMGRAFQLSDTARLTVSVVSGVAC